MKGNQRGGYGPHSGIQRSETEKPLEARQLASGRSRSTFGGYCSSHICRGFYSIWTRRRGRCHKGGRVTKLWVQQGVLSEQNFVIFLQGASIMLRWSFLSLLLAWTDFWTKNLRPNWNGIFFRCKEWTRVIWNGNGLILYFHCFQNTSLLPWKRTREVTIQMGQVPVSAVGRDTGSDTCPVGSLGTQTGSMKVILSCSKMES